MRGVETSDVAFPCAGFVLAELLTSMVADSGFFRDLGPQPDAEFPQLAGAVVERIGVADRVRWQRVLHRAFTAQC